jgi:hypothetical protein
MLSKDAAMYTTTTEEDTINQPLITQETLQGYYDSKKLIATTTEVPDEPNQETIQGHCGSKKLIA